MHHRHQAMGAEGTRALLRSLLPRPAPERPGGRTWNPAHSIAHSGKDTQEGPCHMEWLIVPGNQPAFAEPLCLEPSLGLSATDG